MELFGRSRARRAGWFGKLHINDPVAVCPSGTDMRISDCYRVEGGCEDDDPRRDFLFTLPAIVTNLGTGKLTETAYPCSISVNDICHHCRAKLVAYRRRMRADERYHQGETLRPRPRLSFTRWLKRQVHRDDPVGDLARDVVADATWPRARSLYSFYFYLKWERSADDCAVGALESAWGEWLAASGAGEEVCPGVFLSQGV